MAYMPTKTTPDDDDQPISDLDPRVRDYLTRQMQSASAEQTPEYRKSLRDDIGAAMEQKRSNNFAALLANSAAKIGQIGGKEADSSAMDQFAKAQNAAVDQSMDTEAMKPQGLDPKIIDYVKSRQNAQQMAKENAASLQQRAELKKLEIDAANQRAREHDELLATLKNSGNEKPSLQIYTDEKGNQLAGKKIGGKLIKSPDDEIVTPAVSGANKDLLQAAGKADQIGNYLEEQLKLFDSAKTPEEKIRLGRESLKGMNSTFGADAIGKEEAERLGGALEYGWDPAAKGLTKIAPDPAAFRTQLVNSIKSKRGTAAANRKMAAGNNPGATLEAPAVTGGDGQAVAAPKKTYKDGDTKLIGGQVFVRQGGQWLPQDNSPPPQLGSGD